ncbi:MAG: hypothetical protein RIS76_3324 [Verrucomicrobiota bacterium]|jgi:TatD DNase family protein
MNGSPVFHLADAHNHLQDDRFAGAQEALMATAVRAGVMRMVVNGSGEEDWPRVADLARRFPGVIPAFGCHPWYLRQRSPDWLAALKSWLERTPGAVVGEIGLDRWMIENPDRWRAYRSVDTDFPDPPSLEEQEDAFNRQLCLAAERNVSVSIHCLRAFGRLLELLESHPRPARGFLLHSYGGPAELVPAFVRLGAYFGFPGAFIHERKMRQRQTFRVVPPERLLIETDAPDQRLPDDWNRHPLTDPVTGNPLNHPANLQRIHGFLSEFLEIDAAALARQTTANFERLFGVPGSGTAGG